MQIKVSLGSAQALGLVDKRVDCEATAAHFMIGEGCAFSCAFCAQGQSSNASRRLLSRISWPSFDMEKSVNKLAEAYERKDIKRACIQVVHGGDYRRSLEKFFYLMHRTEQPIPISVNAAVTNLSEADRIFALGADRLGIALDAASPEVYEKTKGNSPAEWVAKVELLKELGATYPARISTHIIVGLGETERDVVEVIQLMNDSDILVGMFAFTPVRGTPMEEHPRPALDAYRRLQIAHYLISRGKLNIDDIVFDDEERILSIPGEFLDEEVFLKGKPFETSGCSGCNRPYYNESPGQIPYNYARPLTPEEVTQALQTAGCIRDSRSMGVADS